MKEKKEKDYSIKIPIFISDSGEDNFENFPFQELAFNRELLVNNLIDKIEKYNSKKEILTIPKKNKTRTKNVGKINFDKIKFGEDDALLIKVTSFNSNFYGSFLESDERIELSKNDKIGSEHYYAILYPQIFGLKERSYKWITLVYEDPNKEITDILTSIKLVLKKVLDINPVNIKPPEFKQRIKTFKSSVDLSLKFTSFDFEENEVDYRLTEYEIKSKKVKIDESSYKNVPINKIEEIIDDKTFLEKFQKRLVKIINGKQELKLTQNYEEIETENKLKEIAEEIFNFTTTISHTDIENNVIYKTEYIKEKIKPVLENYLSSYPND